MAGNVVFISIGSNIQKERNIKMVMEELKGIFGRLRFSPVFETPFAGTGKQGNYYNLCAKIVTTKGLGSLRKLFRLMEEQHGRKRSGKKDAARPLDIDILAFNNTIDRSQNIPYRGMEKTPYVIIPLDSIAADFIVPGHGKTVHRIFTGIPGEIRKSMRMVQQARQAGERTGKPHYYAVVASTIDGFIARYPGHTSSWTSKEDKRHLHLMEKKADVLLLASRSYGLARKALKDKNCIILTTKVHAIETEREGETYLNPAEARLEEYIAGMGYKEVCILGGRVAYDYALGHGLIDDLYLTIEPLVFGSGISMFSTEIPSRGFRLVTAKKMNKTGSMLLHYRKA